MLVLVIAIPDGKSKLSYVLASVILVVVSRSKQTQLNISISFSVSVSSRSRCQSPSFKNHMLTNI